MEDFKMANEQKKGIYELNLDSDTERDIHGIRYILQSNRYGPLPDAHHRARSEFQKFRIGKLPADTKHQTVCTIISLFRTFFQS